MSMHAGTDSPILIAFLQYILPAAPPACLLPHLPACSLHDAELYAALCPGHPAILHIVLAEGLLTPERKNASSPSPSARRRLGVLPNAPSLLSRDPQAP